METNSVLIFTCMGYSLFISYSDKLRTAETDLEVQQEENGHLLGRYNKLVADTQEKDNSTRRR
jgi:hypothetical protein